MLWPSACYFRVSSPGSNPGWGHDVVAFEQDTSLVVHLCTPVYLVFVLVNLILSGRSAVSSPVNDCYSTQEKK